MNGEKITQSSAEWMASLGQLNSHVAHSKHFDCHFSFPLVFSEIFPIGHLLIQILQLSQFLSALKVLLYIIFANGRETNIVPIHT